MILRRLTENLRAQNWMAISIEFLIVVVGVFIGDAGCELEPAYGSSDKTPNGCWCSSCRSLQSQLEFYDNVRSYYATQPPLRGSGSCGLEGRLPS